jgi:hypothetical protein
MRNALLTRAGLLLIVATLAACETAPRWGQRPPPTQPAQAQPQPQVHIALSEQIDARQGEIDNRIEEHFRAGRLTQGQIELLRRMSADIRRDEQRYRSDNDLSLEERRALSNQLDALAREISRHVARR